MPVAPLPLPITPDFVPVAPPPSPIDMLIDFKVLMSPFNIWGIAHCEIPDFPAFDRFTSL
jgi:hypothetical protein